MFDMFFKKLDYEEYNGVSNSQMPLYKEAIQIEGIRLKGQIKVITSDNGDSTTCNIVYKTKQKIIPLSKLNGRTVMECVPVNALWISENNAGYLSYVR